MNATGKSKTDEGSESPAAEIPAVDELRKMKVSALRLLCKANSLPFGTKTKKGDLVELLVSKARGGGNGGYVAGHTLCKYCKAPVRVTSTKRIGDYIVRQLRCRGKRAHTYRIYERVANAA